MLGEKSVVVVRRSLGHGRIKQRLGPLNPAALPPQYATEIASDNSMRWRIGVSNYGSKASYDHHIYG